MCTYKAALRTQQEGEGEVSAQTIGYMLASEGVNVLCRASAHSA